MNIIITGSQGYIGSVLSPALLKNGHKVYGMDNGYFQECKIEEVKNETNYNRKYLSDVSESDFESIDSVVHLAGLQNDPLKDILPGKVYDIEFEYTKKISNICKKKNIKLIYISSCSVYGSGRDCEYLDENSQTNPLTPYSKNKLRIEKYLESISTDAFKPIILRFATVFGYSPRMRFDLYLNQFLAMTLSEKQIHLNSDGSAWRPNLYIGDVPEVIESCLALDNQSSTIINIGNHKSNFQIIDVVKKIKKIHKDLDFKYIEKDNTGLYSDHYVTSKKDKRSYLVNFSKMNELLGHNICSTDLDLGISILSKKLENIMDLNQKIKNPAYFRLQWTKKLIDDRIIDESFRYK